jgi:hypothetical protein
MLSPKEQYNSLSKITKISDIAYDTLFNKYIIRDDRGPDKLTDLESTDQESLVFTLNGGFPIPGLMYTFIYHGQKEDEILLYIAQGQEKKYVDFVPIVFCLGVYPDMMMSGINLNILPNLERLKLLEEYYQIYKAFFKDIEELTENNKLAINKKFIEISKNGDMQKIIKAFSTKTGANFNYAFRKYDFKKIDNLRMIEYSEYIYTIFYDPKNAFRKMNQKQIHDFYWRTKNI